MIERQRSLPLQPLCKCATRRGEREEKRREQQGREGAIFFPHRKILKLEMRLWDDGATPPQRQCRRSPLDGEIKISSDDDDGEWGIHPREEEEEGPRWAMGGAQKGSDQIPISNSSSTAVRAPVSGPKTPSTPRSQECRLSIREGRPRIKGLQLQGSSKMESKHHIPI